MFCPKCGEENKDAALFCQQCGNSFQNPQTGKKTPKWTPLPLVIFFGIAIILADYFFPIVPVRTLLRTQTLSLGQAQDLCHSPLVSCPSEVSVFFYLALLVGIFFICCGLLHKE